MVRPGATSPILTSLPLPHAPLSAFFVVHSWPSSRIAVAEWGRTSPSHSDTAVERQNCWPRFVLVDRNELVARANVERESCLDYATTRHVRSSIMRPQLPTIHPTHPSCHHSTQQGPVGNGRHVCRYSTLERKKRLGGGGKDKRQSGQDVSGERVELPYQPTTAHSLGTALLHPSQPASASQYNRYIIYLTVPRPDKIRTNPLPIGRPK